MKRGMAEIRHSQVVSFGYGQKGWQTDSKFYKIGYRSVIMREDIKRKWMDKNGMDEIWNNGDYCTFRNNWYES